MRDAPATPLPRLPRAQRREQILAAATKAFARAGFAATSLHRHRGRSIARDPVPAQISALVRDQSWARWAAQLSPAVAIEAMIAWLDAGQPDPREAADRIRQVVLGVIGAVTRGGSGAEC